MHGLNLWEPRPRGEAFRAPSRRHSPRVAPPTESVRPAQRSVMHGLLLWEARPRGEAFRAPSGRRSPRVAAPTEKRATGSSTPGTDFVGAPPSGRSFWGTELARFAAGRGSHKKRAPHAERRYAQTAFVGAPPSGRSFWAPSRRHSPRVAPPTKKKRAACIRRPPTQKNRSAGQCGGYCDSTSVTAWRNTPVRSCGLPGSSRSIRSELPRQTSLPSFAS